MLITSCFVIQAQNHLAAVVGPQQASIGGNDFAMESIHDIASLASSSAPQYISAPADSPFIAFAESSLPYDDLFLTSAPQLQNAQLTEDELAASIELEFALQNAILNNAPSMASSCVTSDCYSRTESMELLSR